jgi:uncharacterized coiled-coil DUF342 family protein
MNNERRKKIDDIQKRLGIISAKRDALVTLVDEFNSEMIERRDNLANDWDQLRGELTDIAGEIEELRDEEREGYDNLNEGLQQSERGQNMDSAANALEEGYDAAMTCDVDFPDAPQIEFDMLEKIDEIDGHLDEAASL